MAETSIEWADYTFNPWVGCQRVSPGCEHCYAEAYDKRVGGVPKKQRDHYAALTSLGHTLKPGEQLLRWGPKAPRSRTSPSYWKQPLKWNEKATSAPLGVRPRVFCASLADVFEDRPELVPWREDLFGLIDATQHLDWLLLTKRPENILRLWPTMKRAPDNNVPAWSPSAERWPNVWLGTTVEDQQRADERLPHLLEVPAVVHFLSCEPLLERVILRGPAITAIDWVIIGGESGGGARRFQAAWARSLVEQCKRSGHIAPFVKQMGAFVVDRNDAGFEAEHHVWADDSLPIEERGMPVDRSAWPTPAGGVEHDIDGYRDEYQGAPVRVHLRDRHGGNPAEWPLDLRVREFPEVRRG